LASVAKFAEVLDVNFLLREREFNFFSAEFCFDRDVELMQIYCVRESTHEAQSAVARFFEKYIWRWPGLNKRMASRYCEQWSAWTLASIACFF
jgi:hypothetical protein